MLNRWIVWLVELRARHEGEDKGAQRREIRWAVDDATASAQPREARSSRHIIILIESLCSHMLSRYTGSAARAKSASDFFSSTLNI